MQLHGTPFNCFVPIAQCLIPTQVHTSVLPLRLSHPRHPQAARAARAKAWAAVRARFLGYWAAAWAVLLAYAAYVNRQPHGTYTSAQQAARVAPAFLAPAAGWLVHRLLAWLQVCRPGAGYSCACCAVCCRATAGIQLQGCPAMRATPSVQLSMFCPAINHFLQGVLDRRSAARVKVLEGKLRKQVGTA